MDTTLIATLDPCLYLPPVSPPRPLAREYAGNTMLGNFLARLTNSSKEILPSPSVSHWRMSHSTLRLSCFSLAMLVALTILRSSSLSMVPEPSRSNTWNANLTLSSRAAVPTLDRPTTNSLRSMSPVRSVSNMENRRSTNGLRSTRSRRQNSLMSTMPLLSWSMARNCLYTFFSASLFSPCIFWKDSMSCTGLPGAGACMAGAGCIPMPPPPCMPPP
mmetsp:Transcript_1131/g.2633  ORF Transcript_1131/g.2633 Transcript_1131/m.2633 type:complete len:217 (-) Transcript_1131:7-657(-)